VQVTSQVVKHGYHVAQGPSSRLPRLHETRLVLRQRRGLVLAHEGSQPVKEGGELGVRPLLALGELVKLLCESTVVCTPGCLHLFHSLLQQRLQRC
jgi:hypothetical protein